MKKFLSLVLALVMTMSLVTVSAGAKDFTDADDITYVEAVDVMTAIGVVDGDTAGNFNPTNGLTRGAAAKIICNMILGPTTASALNADTNPYPDVDKDSVFAGYIAYCQKEGIISGYADGTFKPANPLTGYAFMKMLLGALGYDANVEGYTGANWSINVAKQAIGIGLEDGLVEDFNGSDFVNREEAMLYAYNTLLSTMVEYDAKTEVSVGDANVVIAGSKAYPVSWDEGIKNDGNIDPDGMVQFAEKHFAKLELDVTSDAFMCPADVWTLKGKEIGTYTWEADEVYTTGTTFATIYKDLGLSKANTVKEYYEDGQQQTAITLQKGDVTNKVGGQGVTSYVYYDSKTDVVTICKVNTYVGEIAAAYKATASKDAYVVVGQRDVNANNTPYAGLVNWNANTTFETDIFNVDEIVLFTYSNKTGSVGIQSLALAEQVEGTLTNYTENEQAVLNGTPYKYNVKIASEATTAFINKGVDATFVLDTYGNVIDITDKGVVNYAVVLKLKTDADIWNDTNMARLLLTDGTTVDVNLTNTKASGTTVNAGNVTIGEEDIVSYTVDNKGKYTLAKLATKSDSNFKVINGNALVDVDGSGTFGNGDANANGKTIFLVKSGTTTDPIYTAYTGIKAVPSISTIANMQTTNAVYCKPVNGNPSTIATVVYVDVISTATVDTKDVIFVQMPTTINKTEDTVYGSYYTYDAIVNGEITKLNIAGVNGQAPINEDTIFDSVSYTTYSDGAKVATLGTGVNSQTQNGNSGNLYYATGTDKDFNGAVGLGNSWYVPSDDCDVFFIDADGEMAPSSVASIAEDPNDIAFFKMTNGEITTIVIKSVAGNGGGGGPQPGSNGVSSVYASIYERVGITVKTVGSTSTISYKYDEFAANINSSVNAGIAAAMTGNYGNNDERLCVGVQFPAPANAATYDVSVNGAQTLSGARVESVGDGTTGYGYEFFQVSGNAYGQAAYPVHAMDTTWNVTVTWKDTNGATIGNPVNYTVVRDVAI